jgi:ferric-dicitrate binding protein FerR (iron transport regulator)
MNNNSHIDVDHLLLGKYLAGEASPAEAIHLEEWLAASPANKQLFNEISNIWSTLSSEQNCTIPDKETFLQHIKNRASQPPPSKTISLKKTLAFTKIAASIIGIVGTVILFTLLNKKKQPLNPITITRQTGQTTLNDTLPDGSIATINNHSLLQYPFQFTGNREVQLNGEAFFNVTPDASKPFIISAGPVHIKVIGTSFNVRNGTDSIEVVVRTGVVRVYNNRNSLTIKAGKKGIYHIPTQRFLILDTFNVNEVAYATKIFNFENATLKEIAHQLQKAYGIKIVITNKDLEACTMSSSFDNKSIEYIFEVLAMTLNIQYRIEQKTVYISGSSCT